LINWTTSLRFRSFRSVFRRVSLREGPLAALDVVLFRRPQLEQMTDRGRQDVLVALEELLLLGETAQRARDVRGHGRFLGNDQCF
jgi:hypothetical protein